MTLIGSVGATPGLQSHYNNVPVPLYFFASFGLAGAHQIKQVVRDVVMRATAPVLNAKHQQRLLQPAHGEKLAFVGISEHLVPLGHRRVVREPPEIRRRRFLDLAMSLHHASHRVQTFDPVEHAGVQLAQRHQLGFHSAHDTFDTEGNRGSGVG